MADNVVQVVVKATDDTAGGFASAKAGADGAADGMDTYASAADKATDAQARFDDAQKEQADAAGRVAALQKDEAASADELAAAQSRLTEASLASADARSKLATAEADVAAKSKIAGDEQVESGLKSDESSGLMAGAGSKVKTAFLGIAVGAGYAIDKAMEYDEQSTQLVTGAGELDKNLKMVKQGMLDVSTATATSLTQVQSGMYMIESAGYHGASGLKVLTAAAQGAKVGNADLGTVADATTTVLTDYKMSADNATSATSGLVAIVAAGKTHLTDLSSSLSKVLPTASALKIPFDEVGGAMATMTGQGVSARLAATHLNSTMIAMVNPSATAKAAMESVGITSTQVGNTLTRQGLTAALEQVTNAAGKKFPVGSAQYVAAVSTMLAGSSGLSTALQLTGSHLSTLKANTDSVAASMKGGSKDVQGWNEVQADASFRLEKTKQAAENTAVSFGEALMPAVTDILGPLSSFLGFIAQSSAASTALAAIIGGVLAVYLGSKLVNAFSEVGEGAKTMLEVLPKIAAKIGLVTTATEAQTTATEAGTAATEEADAAMSVNPVMLIIAAIALLVIGIVELIKHWHAVEDAAKEVWHAVTAAVSEAFDWIKTHWPLLLAILTGPVGLATLFIVDHWKQIVNGAKSMLDDVVSFFRGLPGRIMSALGSLGSMMFNAGVHAIESLISGILSMAGSVGNAMGGIASKIAGFIGLSPAKEGPLSGGGAPEIRGQHIVADIAKGMNAASAQGVQAMSQLTFQVSQAAVAGLPGHTQGTQSARDVLTGLTDSASEAREKAASLATWIKEALAHGMPANSEGITSARQVLAGLDSQAGEATARASNLAARIHAPLSGSLDTSMHSAGQSAMQYLIDGIGSMVSDVGSVMSGIASKIAGFIGLSPAKEGPLSGGGAPEIRGAHIAADIAKGMLSGHSAVAAAAQHLAGSAAIGSSGAGGTGAAGGGGQITLQIQAGGGGSGLDQMFMQWIKNNVRVSGGDPRIFNKKVQFI